MSQHLITAVLFDGHLSLEWEEGNLPEHIGRKKLEQLISSLSKNGDSGTWLISLGLSDSNVPLSESLEFWRTLAALWVHQVRTNPDSETKRDTFSADFQNEDTVTLLSGVPPMIGVDLIDKNYLTNTWSVLNTTFQKGIKSFQGSVESWFKTVAPDLEKVDRIHFHLVENKKDVNRPFAFLATYTTRVDQFGRVRHVPLKAAFQEFGDDKKKLLELLAAVKKVARVNSLIQTLEKTGELFNPVFLAPQEAFEFLNGVHQFEEAGILCRIPRWWKGVRKVAVTLNVGSKAPSKVGYDALLNFTAGLQIDGEDISASEIREILEQSEGLAFIKGKWVAVDKVSLQNSLDILDKARKLAEKEQLTFADAMKMLMGAKPENDLQLSNIEITCGDWLSTVLEKMKNPSLIRTVEPEKNLKADLRVYQQHGLNWLHFLHTLGFGACLADDMGLGKTLQILALLQKVKKKGGTSLIVVPSSLLENWRREIEKFTPDLKVILVHPQSQTSKNMSALQIKIPDYDIAITTYTMISRCEWIGEYEWLYVICDEAQAIKNPQTTQTKAVKKLHCKYRCVMTGTPVENRLTDLWSLFDFVNPGLLGSFNEFKKFSKSLQDNPQGYGKLRQVVQPYILRRSKSDKSIISDLPDKIEMKTYCLLSKEQKVIYGNLVKKLLEELDNSEGIKRKGIVLGYLMKFKQLCNHPDQFSGAGQYETAHSGKFARLAELCETIRDKREKVLVFTQFAEIIKPLDSFLESVFGAPGVTLSGESTVKQRKTAVDTFQNTSAYVPFFILSLKAGGTGLNLTEANHVIHFDRWWNPAVENQATDRAYRIGQKKNVVVHKFICKGTIEDKIDEMIEDKKKLADEIIGSSTNESWISEFDDTRIREMFRLTISETEND